MGGSAKTVGRVGSGVLTLGGSEIARNNLGPNNTLSKVLQTPGMILTGGQSGGYGNAGGVSSSGNDTFSIDPAQIAADQKAITDLGNQQYSQTMDFNTSDQAARAAMRDKLSGLLTQNAKNVFSRSLPNIAENAQAAHLYDSTGYGQEVARQQSYLGQDIANQMGQVGLQDINRSSDIGLGALQAQQGAGQSALGRGFSLSDFVRSANVSKAIGAQMAPQVGSGKGQTGTALAGAGGAATGLSSLLKLGGKGAGAASGGPAGAAAGGMVGDLFGSGLG